MQRYFAGFALLAATGMALVNLFHSGWARGLGSALLLVGAIGFLVDGFASRRATPYAAAVARVAQEPEGPGQ